MADNMITQFSRLAVLLLGTALLFSACATRTDIVARVNPGYAPSLTNRIAFSPSSYQTEQLHLAEVVKAEFIRRGLEFVPSAKSEYVLGCWIEENQEQKQGRAVIISSPDQYSPRVSSPLPPGLSGGVYVSERGGPFMRTVEVPNHGGLSYIGIRMRLFVTHPKNSNVVETAWEGHIDAGARLADDEYGPLVRTLMDYFGKNHFGRVTLVE